LVKFLLSQGADPDLAELKLRSAIPESCCDLPLMIVPRRASHFSKFRAIAARASDNEKALAKFFPDTQEFREDLQLSPILTTILREYDPLDIEKPTLGDIIHFALEVVKHFPAKDLKAWIPEYQGRSPLYHEVVESLEKSSRESKSCTSALSSLLEQADELQGWKPVHWAAFVGRLDDFKLLRENRADLSAITTSGRNVIHQAAETGAVEILEYLLQGDVQAERLDINLPDIWGETPLHVAAARSAACAKMLAEHGANVEARQDEGEIPLHYVKYLKGKDRIEALGALLAVGCRQVNTTDKTGRPPIYHFLDTPESVSLLLDHGADVTIADSKGTTVTHLVCAQNRPNILDMILRRSTPQVIAVKDHGGDTPLFTSFRNHSVECVKILLNRAAFSSLKDADGCSPVHHAVKMGDPGVLELALTIPGIDIYSKNKLGQDAFDIAAEMKTMDRRIGEILATAASSY
jgi:ankyrin repeat protein